MFCIMFAILVLALSGDNTRFLHNCRCKPVKIIERLIRRLREIWRSAGMRFKLKAFCGLYQCISAVPSVFNVVIPPGLEEYTKWVNLLEFPADFGVDIIVPAACFGSYSRCLCLELYSATVLAL
jgi:cobalamin biosynthesis protein CobD/CbiB